MMTTVGLKWLYLSAVSNSVSCPAVSHLMAEFYLNLPTSPWNFITVHISDVVSLRLEV